MRDCERERGRSSSKLARTALVLVLLSLCGSVRAQSSGNAAAPGTAAAAARSAPSAPVGPSAAGTPDASAIGVDPSSYVIGAQDQLFVRVWREQDFTAPYIVRPDGKITVPLLGDVQAAGVTPERLAAQLKQGLMDYLNNPDVTVTITQVNSKKYFVTGGVLRTGEYPLAVPIHVFDALTNAGGFRDFANKKKVVIIRGAERIKFNYSDILKGKNLEQNILLQNGDTVFVPE